ncbi:hypothetical protein F4774DRAFT_412694 [Daldinia eschscholtzii]|nr:hypothetical protein F4774DRAFT_412694 [Daldinia eschscholtzii]
MQWHSFLDNSIIPIYRLIPLGILILLLRRMPLVLALYKKISQIDGLQQAIFMGFFGPIGCSAVFYLYVTLEFIDTLNPNHGSVPRWDVAHLKESVSVLVWFMVICSVVVHGLSIPLGKFGFYLPRTISRSLTSAEDVPFQIGARIVPQSRSRDVTATHTPTDSRSVSARPVFRVGGSIIAEHTENTTEAVGAGKSQDELETSPKPVELGSFPNAASPTLHNRTIRFPDESSSTGKNSQEPNRDITAGS